MTPFVLAQAAASPEAIELVPSMWRMAGGLLVVLALLGGLAWFLKKTAATRRAGGAMHVETALALGERRSLVILHNTVVPPGVGVAGLQQYVEQGGGLFVIAGDRASWPSNDTTVLPGPIGETVDRIDRVGSFGYVDHSHYVRTYFLTEVYRSWEGPVWGGLFVEHKNLLGLTVRAEANNLLNARHRWTRFVYTDWRDRSPIDYIQRNNQLIGPIFSLSVKGTF